MIILTKKLNLKGIALIMLLSASALFLDYNSPDSEMTYNEARFLGIGKKKTEGPCNQLGYKTIKHEYTFLWIRVGSSHTTEEAC